MWHTLCSEEIWVGLRLLGTLKDEFEGVLEKGPIGAFMLGEGRQYSQLEVTWFLLFAS